MLYRVEMVDVGDLYVCTYSASCPNKLEISSQQGVIPTTPSPYIYHFYPIIAMVDWNDPDLEAKLRTLSVQLFYAIFGLYG
jgi:hypothetical protein